MPPTTAPSASTSKSSSLQLYPANWSFLTSIFWLCWEPDSGSAGFDPEHRKWGWPGRGRVPWSILSTPPTGCITRYVATHSSGISDNQQLDVQYLYRSRL